MRRQNERNSERDYVRKREAEWLRFIGCFSALCTQHDVNLDAA